MQRSPDMENADISAVNERIHANIELDGLYRKKQNGPRMVSVIKSRAFEIKDGAYVEMK